MNAYFLGQCSASRHRGCDAIRDIIEAVIKFRSDVFEWLVEQEIVHWFEAQLVEVDAKDWPSFAKQAGETGPATIEKEKIFLVLPNEADQVMLRIAFPGIRLIPTGTSAHRS